MSRQNELDQLCINTIRTLSMDAVQAANSGHPGTPMALAPLTYLLWTRHLKHNPADPAWLDRDRFILSAGHASMLLYSMLYLSGYGLELEDLKEFRQWESVTPGHPEYGMTRGVETTTGPLGQGAHKAAALDFGPAELQHAEADMEALLSLYKSLEFRSWIKELEDQGIEAEPAADIGQPLLSESADDANAAFARAPATQNYVTVSDEAALQALCDSLARAERLALFPIAEDGHYKRAPLTGLGLSTAPGEAFYLPLGHDMMGAAEQLPITQVLERLQPFLESQSLFKVGHDLKHCTHVLARYGISLKGRRYDTMLQSYVLNSVAHRHTLERITEQYLDESLQSADELRGKGRNRLAFAQLDIASAAAWACRSADLCLRAHAVLAAELAAVPGLVDVYRYIEIALLPVLARMEAVGIKVDTKALALQSEQLGKRLAELTGEVRV